jgi:hypothetical protein
MKSLSLATEKGQPTAWGSCATGECGNISAKRGRSIVSNQRINRRHSGRWPGDDFFILPDAGGMVAAGEAKEEP